MFCVHTYSLKEIYNYVNVYNFFCMKTCIKIEFKKKKLGKR